MHLRLAQVRELFGSQKEIVVKHKYTFRFTITADNENMPHIDTH